MTREKEIDVAATHYDYGYNSGSRLSAYCCFRDGAEWADMNPKSPWISIKDDLPCNHKELISEIPKIIHSKEVLATKNVLVVLTYNIVKLVSMVYNEINNKWEWDSIFKDEIVFWMLIPELPKEYEVMYYN